MNKYDIYKPVLYRMKKDYLAWHCQYDTDVAEFESFVWLQIILAVQDGKKGSDVYWAVKNKVRNSLAKKDRHKKRLNLKYDSVLSNNIATAKTTIAVLEEDKRRCVQVFKSAKFLNKKQQEQFAAIANVIMNSKEQIDIKDACKKANVPRSSFYNIKSHLQRAKNDKL